uniref:Uncharacterized protein n=1 Tax=Acrobeloides nanus TaxID=290746 RepID=A0A914C4B5_9BILA
MGAAYKKGYGLQAFLASIIFCTGAIVYVKYDEQSKRERRQVGVNRRLRTMQQEQNMEEYKEQRKYFDAATSGTQPSASS